MMVEFHYDCPICGKQHLTFHRAIFCCATIPDVKDAIDEEENGWSK